MFPWLTPEVEDSDTLIDHLEQFTLASWYAVALSASFWTLLYLSVRYTFQSKSAEWCNRLITLFHGIITAAKGMQECCQDGEWCFANPDEDTTTNQMLILVTSLGYFIFDLGWCLAYETETNLMVFHHIYSCIALYRVLVSEVSGAQATCGLAAMEITNPFLQLRWFLRSEGFYQTTIFKIIEFIFIILFFIVRIVIGSYFFGAIMFFYPNDWEFRLLTVIIYILSWLFLVNIVKFIYLKYIEQNIRHIEQDLHTST